MMNISAYSPFFRPLISAVFCLASLFLSIFDLPGIPYGKDIDMSKFELTWADEFDGNSLDRTKWGGHYFWGEESAVRKGGYWDLSLAGVKDGSLHIATKYYPEGLNSNGKPGWYTCGIDTRGRFEQKFGYFEVRCILPKGVGLWSAFWVHCDGVSSVDNEGRDGTEIDVFESATEPPTDFIVDYVRIYQYK